MLKVIGLGLCLVASSAFAETITKSVVASLNSLVDIKNGAGDVSVVGENVEEVTVTANLKKWSSDCQLKVEQSSKKVKISAEQTAVYGPECVADLTVVAPLAVKLDIETGSGDVDVANTTGGLTFRTGSGNMKVASANLQRLEGKTGSGNVTIAAALAEGELKAGSGNIKLTFPKAPTAGLVTIVSGSGNTSVQMPKETKVSSDLKTGSGNVTNELDDIKDAKFKLSIRTGSGDVSIKKL